MIGVIVVALSCVAAAYLILKRYYAPGALLLVGCLTLCVAIFVGPGPLVAAKKATHCAGLDVIQTVTNLFQTRSAGLGMNIMAMAGFATYMSKLGASKAMVDACINPLKKIKSPYAVMTIAYALGIFFNIFIPSAAGLSLLMMVAVYPLMVAAGVSRQAAAATILAGTTFALSPGGANNLLASKLLNIHVTEFWANTQLMIAVFAVPVSLVVHYFVQKWFDKRDLAKGLITEADFGGQIEVDDKKAKEPKAPAFYALFPIIPVAMLVIFSPLVYKGIRMEFVTAMLTSTFLAFALDLVCRRNLKVCVANIKAYAEGMGKVFTSTVFLIVSAEVFAAGLTKSGGIGTIITYVSHMSVGAIALYTTMFLIIALLSFLVGSGNAAFFSFAPLIPQAAQAVGLNPAAMLSSFQLVSGCGRSSSPIAGGTIVISGISGIDPFTIIRRTIPVMIVTAVVIYARTLTMI